MNSLTDDAKKRLDAQAMIARDSEREFNIKPTVLFHQEKVGIITMTHAICYYYYIPRCFCE